MYVMKIKLLSSKERNKIAHIINGNIHGMKVSFWNKGSAYISNPNKLVELESLLQQHKPHVFALTELQLRQIDIPNVKFNGYTLIYDNMFQAHGISRVGILIHDDVVFERIKNLESPDLATIWIKVGLPHREKCYIQLIYRQWQLPNQLQDHNSSSITSQLNRFKLILEKWNIALATGKEVITIGDFNLN